MGPSGPGLTSIAVDLATRPVHVQNLAVSAVERANQMSTERSLGCMIGR
jgi:hypothetical protein